MSQALLGLHKVPQKTVNVCWSGPARAAVEMPEVRQALVEAQAAVQGRGRVFLRPSGTEPVVRITVEADDVVLMQQTLDRLADVVRDAA